MSNVIKEQLALTFKHDALAKVSQTEIALLADWIEDILAIIDADEDSQVVAHRLN